MIFMQTLPTTGDWTLLNPDRRAAQLRYKNAASRREILVPSIWYNQPVSWRVEYFRFCAERAWMNARRLRQSRDMYERRQADEMVAQAKRLETDANEMERTGRFVEQQT